MQNLNAATTIERRTALETQSSPEPQWSPRRYRHIVAPTTLDAGDRSALTLAMELASLHQATLSVLYVLPDGELGSLLEYAREDQESLVMKPNRAYGGEGVLIGLATEKHQWEQALQRALEATEPWVIQQLASIPVNEFPVIGDDGSVHSEPFYTVMGFAPSKYGLAILGRASQKQVVNVAQRGGMCAVMLGYPPGRLVGPE